MRRFPLAFCLLVAVAVPPTICVPTALSQTQDSGTTLTDADIISMSKARLGADVIIAKIESSQCDFDTSPAALERMKSAGVPESAILAVVKAPVASATASHVQAGPQPRTGYVPCMASSLFLFKGPAPGAYVETLKEGSPVTVLGHDGEWFKLRAPSGKVGYINKRWMCKKADYEARMSPSPSSPAATNTATTTQAFQPSHQTAIRPNALRAAAWRAQPWTTTTYYQRPARSTTSCMGSGTWLGLGWTASASCKSQYTPAQMIPLNWTHYTVYNLVETANNWVVLSCTINWRFSQCRHLIPGETYFFSRTKGGQIAVMGQKKVKYSIVAVGPRSDR